MDQSHRHESQCRAFSGLMKSLDVGGSRHCVEPSLDPDRFANARAMPNFESQAGPTIPTENPPSTARRSNDRREALERLFNANARQPPPRDPDVHARRGIACRIHTSPWLLKLCAFPYPWELLFIAWAQQLHEAFQLRASICHNRTLRSDITF
jgi:hypothetical protein